MGAGGEMLSGWLAQTPAFWRLRCPEGTHSNEARMPRKRTGHACQWDAEGRIASVDSGSTWSFTYDALGDRVQWVSPSGTSEYYADISGNLLGVSYVM